MSSLDDMIDSLRKLGRTGADVAKEAAPLVEAALKKTADAGTDPEGGAWDPRKDGGRAMANASSHISVSASGNLIRATLTGPDVFHHYSKKATEPQRRVLPDGGAGIPAHVDDALQAAAGRVFARAMGGA